MGQRAKFRPVPEAQALESVALYAKTPCCWHPVKIQALVDVPKQVQDRVCRSCGLRWQVTRKYAKTTSAGRIDILEWEPK